MREMYRNCLRAVGALVVVDVFVRLFGDFVGWSRI